MISRFARLFDTTPAIDAIGWDKLFDEFSAPVTFRGDDQHPGWAPTEFEPAQRALANVRRVHAMVLDYDNTDPKTKQRLPDAELVTVDDAVELWGEFYGLVHTTRKHTSDWHRFRVILPYTRFLSPFEQTGTWYRVNAYAGGKLDPSPKDPSRFWYTPGVSNIPGACFEARRLTGALFDPDEWLKRPDPNMSGQPLQGSIPINANVRETRARAYLAKMPEAVAGQRGHDSLWAATRKLIADFGLDDDTAFRLLLSEYNPRCRPPWSEKEIRHKVKQAARARVANPVEPDRPQTGPRPVADTWSPERAAAEREAHDPPPARALASGDDEPPPAPPVTAPDPEAPNWRVGLRCNQKGGLTKDPGNAALILRYHPEWAGCLEYNEFSDQITWARRPPDIGFVRPEIGERFQNHHAIAVQHWLAKVEFASFPKAAVWDAIEEAARANPIHPLRDHLKNIVWDGEKRLSRWLPMYFGADETDYTCAVGRWWLISAIARAFQPGCQADHVLILEGAQGGGKSSGMRILGGEWYLGSMPDIRDRDRAAAVLQGNWIVEIGELDAFRGAAATRVKDFITQPFDEYRAAYARHPARRMRGCVFVGTTNEITYLQDASGARRFWPVRIGRLEREALARDRDQLLVEARLAYEAGEPWWPTDQFAAELAEAQDERFEDDEWLTRIAKWVRGGELKMTPRDAFTVGEVLEDAIGLEAGKWDRSAQTRVGNCLRRMGFKSRLESEGSSRVRRYHARTT